MLKRPLTAGIGLMMLVTLLIYANHFENSFHFDDFHTIVNNANIRTLKNIPLFFTDGSTSSVLPQNQAYRPVTVLSLALDYWLGGDYYPSYFQTPTFILFLLQGALMVYFFRKVFDASSTNSQNGWLAVLIVTWYMLHPAMAETVNYIIARTDLQSTLLVLLGFVLYVGSPFCRKTYLYLLVVGIGILCKTTAVMFGPMLFFYILFFESGLGLADLFRKVHRKQVLNALLKTLPALLFCGLLFWFTGMMTPKSWQPGGTSALKYLITQPFVILHYFCEFFLPTGLSADTDWKLLPSIWDVRFFAGCAFVVAMLAIAVYTSKRKETRPISFGILWFFLALGPTSSIIPLAEVLNDHRMFFPFVGLVMSVGWTLVLLWQKYGSPANKRRALALVAVALVCYACGTYQRNLVWHDEASLWRDVTLKSPGNARGLMNYGLALYSQGDYPGAEGYLKKAEKLSPEYSVIYTNLGLIKEVEGDPALAENYYKSGVKLGSTMPDPLCYYASFLVKQWRYTEAVPLLEKSIKLSPLYLTPRLQLIDAWSMTGDWDSLKQQAKQTLRFAPQNATVLSYLAAAEKKENGLDYELENIRKNPNTAQYASLAARDFQEMRYEQCIAVSELALKLNPKDIYACNNIGAAYNKLHAYDKALGVLKKALAINPGFLLAKNNLKAAEDGLKDKAAVNPLADNYINLSLYYFNEGRFDDCIDACNHALTLRPGYDLAYNNICAANNKLGHYDEAIAAARIGLQVNPQNIILRNNLAEAIAKKSGSSK